MSNFSFKNFGNDTENMWNNFVLFKILLLKAYVVSKKRKIQIKGSNMWRKEHKTTLITLAERRVMLRNKHSWFNSTYKTVLQLVIIPTIFQVPCLNPILEISRLSLALHSIMKYKGCFQTLYMSNWLYQNGNPEKETATLQLKLPQLRLRLNDKICFYCFSCYIFCRTHCQILLKSDSIPFQTSLFLVRSITNRKNRWPTQRQQHGILLSFPYL